MAKTFADMRHQLQVLQEALEALGTTIDEDRPTRDDVVVAASLGDAVLSVRGILEDARAAADDACESTGHPLDMERARRALTTCQRQFHRFAAEFSHDLASYERMFDLESIAQERGRDWAGWVMVVKQGLEQCQALVEAQRDALFASWQELTERLSVASVSIHATNVGQQFSVRDSIGEPLKRSAVA